MPTFTAIALDRLLEPGASKSADKSFPKPKPAPNYNRLPNSKLERRNSTSVAERKIQRPQIQPSLYATPESTPLPDSPSSFPPSPYIVNHKRRGPRLVKSFSEDDVSSHKKTLDEEKIIVNTKELEANLGHLTKGASITSTIPKPNDHDQLNGVYDPGSSNHQLGSTSNDFGSRTIQPRSSDRDTGSSGVSNGLASENVPLELVKSNSERVGENEDFFDPQESMSFTSNTDVEDNEAESAAKLNSAMGEFFDAWEELSSEGGRQPPIHNVEAELREMRLSLLMEIEKRKQAEEALNNLQNQWQKLRQQLSLVGLTLPTEPPVVSEGEQLDSDTGDDLSQQVYLARFVSDSIGRGIVRAELETEMESHIESKNFEIARLLDRLHYYEAVNHEMSQRNQEAVEVARRERLRRKRRQRWIWVSVAAAITVGTTALAWSYFPTGKESSSSGDNSHVEEHDDAAEP